MWSYGRWNLAQEGRRRCTSVLSGGIGMRNARNPYAELPRRQRLVYWNMMPLNDVLLIGRDQALEHRDLTADRLTAFRLPDVAWLCKLLDFLHRRNNVSALG